jgi:uncharacterized membrane protein
MAVSKQKAKRRPPRLIRILRGRLKLIISIAVGIALALALPSDWPAIARILTGWDTTIALYLCIVCWTFARSEVSHIAMHAEQQDEGRVAVLVLTVTATIASIAAIILLLGEGKGKSSPPQLLFAAATVILSWAFIHLIFALHYAHEFYTKTPPVGGLEFPGGKKPDYWDFTYFSFVIGMTFQVSDVEITARGIRRTVLCHGVVAFLFNVALLAIMINIAASAI